MVATIPALHTHCAVLIFLLACFAHSHSLHVHCFGTRKSLFLAYNRPTCMSCLGSHVSLATSQKDHVSVLELIVIITCHTMPCDAEHFVSHASFATGGRDTGYVLTTVLGFRICIASYFLSCARAVPRSCFARRLVKDSRFLIAAGICCQHTMHGGFGKLGICM